MVYRAKPLKDRFWAKVEKTNNCWNWLGVPNSSGYGTIKLQNGSSKLAHRISYVMHKGLIPEGLQLDHLCRNRLCVNPEHLEAVTAQENVLRGNASAAIQASRDTCKYGHEFDLVDKRGKRVCLTCRKRNNTINYALRSSRGL